MMFKVYGNQQKEIRNIKEILKNKNRSFIFVEYFIRGGKMCLKYLLEAFVCEVLDIVINQFERIQL